jgi:hypothetical protein
MSLEEGPPRHALAACRRRFQTLVKKDALDGVAPDLVPKIAKSPRILV